MIPAMVLAAVVSLPPCPNKPNCVSTQATDAHAIAPIRYRSAQPQAMQRLLDVLRGVPRSRIVQSGADSVRVEFPTSPSTTTTSG